MHFALPPRKSSQPPPYTRVAARSRQNRQRSQVQIAGVVILCLISFWFFLRTVLSPFSNQGIAEEEDVSDDHFNIVIVTVLDEESMSEAFVSKVKANRDDYAARHGYTTFYANTSTYSSLYHPAPRSWALVVALRHALTLHPTSTHIFSLTPYALITHSGLSLESHILDPALLPSLMEKDIPVVPPDSVIHTFSHITPQQTHLILSQDLNHLCHKSMILRNSLWSRYFLDTWFDPLYRTYNFLKAESHALEHIVQWHPTILAKLVLIEQRRMNSYSYAEAPEQDESGSIRSKDTMWRPGDFLVNFEDCDVDASRDCEHEFNEYYERWRKDTVEIMGGILGLEDVS